MGRSAIIIPARYDSKRLPGKPLALIEGRTLLDRVCATAFAVRGGTVPVLVATDDDRIASAARTYGAESIMTPSSCPSGTDRVHSALVETGNSFDYLVNMQGDAPFTHPTTVETVLDCLESEAADVVTAVRQLSWRDLDILREAKRVNPFSGTTAVVADDGRAIWFSKAIIPAIRDESERRKRGEDSVILKHIGIYGYKRPALAQFVASGASHYERCEGLEQLRFLELGMRIQAIHAPANSYDFSLGVDSPQDLLTASEIIRHHGEPEWIKATPPS